MRQVDIKIFDNAFMKKLAYRSRKSVRRRESYNIHENFDEPCQRLFNAIQSDSYIRPHRHMLDPKEELLVCISGKIGLVIFDDFGAIIDLIVLTAGVDANQAISAVEIAPHVWHTAIALQPDCILLEIKAGPFDQSLAKDSAPWAPAENTVAAKAFLLRLKENFRFCAL